MPTACLDYDLCEGNTEIMTTIHVPLVQWILFETFPISPVSAP